MSGTRILTHLVSVALLFLWGGVMLYFYASNRIAEYLPPDGIFQPMVLVAGVGLVILGLFNLFTFRNAEHDCCAAPGHDHQHDHAGCCQDPNHAHTAPPSPATHSDTCCGGHHDHGHDQAHHDHHEHAHAHTHAHGHTHEPHAHTHEEHTHAHGMLEESGPTGRFVAIAILAIPITLAALNTPDAYSPAAIANKGLYNPNYTDTSRAEEFSLKKSAAPAAPGIPSAAPAPKDLSTPPTVATTPPPANIPPSASAPPSTPPGSAAPPAVAGSDAAPPPAQSYGSFTLADLEAQVPKSAAGNFILDVPEIYYTGGDVEVQGVLKGQSVETIAQILPEKVNNDDGHRLRIFRMLVQCCAADARPYSIPVDFGKKAPEYKEMTWVKIVGTMNYKQEGGQTVPILEAKTIEETTAPDQTMIY